MPRGKVSASDRALVDALRQRGYAVSPYKLERWRAKGLMPKNVRRSLGRGRGTVSTPAPDAAACAAMLSESRSDASKIVRYLIGTVRSPYRFRPRDGVVARRPTMMALRQILMVDDLLNMTEDEAYAQAEYFSNTQFISFSRDRYPALSDLEDDVVAHKRDMYQHYLVASYLGVNAVGEGLLRRVLLDLGMASNGVVDTALAFLGCNFTSAANRWKLLSELPLDEILYNLSLAAFLLVVDPDCKRNHFQGESLRIADQLTRFQELDMGWIEKVADLLVEPEIFILVFLVKDRDFREQVEYVLGNEFLTLLRERMAVIDNAVIVKSLPSDLTVRRDEAFQEYLNIHLPGLAVG